MGVPLGDLDRDVQGQEAERGGAQGPVDALGEQPAAGQQDRTARGDQPPDDGGREGDERQYTAREVEEAAQWGGPGEQEESEGGDGSGGDCGAAAQARAVRDRTARDGGRRRAGRGGVARAVPGAMAARAGGRAGQDRKADRETDGEADREAG